MSANRALETAVARMNAAEQRMDWAQAQPPSSQSFDDYLAALNDFCCALSEADDARALGR
jgi:hypothetical protein